MIDPKHLHFIKQKKHVKQLLNKIDTKLIDINLYEQLVDWLWENFYNQKETLKKLKYDQAKLHKNSDEWKIWIKETNYLNSKEATYSEEIWKTLELWFNRSNHTDNRYSYLIENMNSPKGVMSGARFAVFKFFQPLYADMFVDPEEQAVFIDTLQHERIHLFRRHYNLLKYDIPFAAALGLLTAQSILANFGYTYAKWELSTRFFRFNSKISGCRLQRKKVFLSSIRSLIRKYQHQIEDRSSYVDGHDLAIASFTYFRKLSKARVFVELLAYGISPKNAHEAAMIEKEEYRFNSTSIVMGEKRNKLQLLGIWNPDPNNSQVLCARHAIKKATSSIKKIFIDNSISDLSLPFLIGLRGADQMEAHHFDLKETIDLPYYYSIPYSCYCSAPLMDSVCSDVEILTAFCEPYNYEFEEFRSMLKSIGLENFPNCRISEELTKEIPELDEKYKTYKCCQYEWLKYKSIAKQIIIKANNSDVY